MELNFLPKMVRLMKQTDEICERRKVCSEASGDERRIKKGESAGSLLVEAAVLIPLVAGIVLALAYAINSQITAMRMANSAHLIAVALKADPEMSDSELEDVVSASLGPQPAPSGGSDDPSPGISQRAARVGMRTFSTIPSDSDLENIPVVWSDDPDKRDWRTGFPQACPEVGPLWLAVVAEKGLWGLSMFGFSAGGFGFDSNLELTGKSAKGYSVVRIGSQEPGGSVSLGHFRVKNRKTLRALGAGYNLHIAKVSGDGSAYFTRYRGASIFLKKSKTTKVRFIDPSSSKKKIGLDSHRVTTVFGGYPGDTWDGTEWRMQVDFDNGKQGVFKIWSVPVCNDEQPISVLSSDDIDNDGFSDHDGEDNEDGEEEGARADISQYKKDCGGQKRGLGDDDD